MPDNPTLPPVSELDEVDRAVQLAYTYGASANALSRWLAQTRERNEPTVEDVRRAYEQSSRIMSSPPRLQAGVTYDLPGVYLSTPDIPIDYERVEAAMYRSMGPWAARQNRGAITDHAGNTTLLQKVDEGQNTFKGAVMRLEEIGPFITLFNTCGTAIESARMALNRQVSDPYMTERWGNDTEHLRILNKAQSAQRDRCRAWVYNYNQRNEKLRRRIEALNARPDLAGFRHRNRWTKEQVAHLRALNPKVKGVLKDLKSWAEGNNPGLGLSVLNDLSDLPVPLRHKLPEKARRAVDLYHSVRDKVQYQAGYRRPVWFHDGAYEGIHNVTLCRVSDEDPMQVCYIQSITKLMHGVDTLDGEPLWTRIKPGRFLKKFIPGMSDELVREWAQKHEAEFKPVEVKFVENDDPEGWEQCYEYGAGFTSCMTYERNDGSSRYLHTNCCGENHPVRTYARKGNGLRLAYIGDLKPGGVKARSIVRDDDDEKGYIRIYGDDRLREALRQAGYENRVSLQGVEITRREASWDRGTLIVPYLDSGDRVEDHGDCLVIGRDGDIDAQCSSGLSPGSSESYECPHCGANHEDEDHIHYSDYEEQHYCSSCEDDYTYAIISKGRYGVERDMVLNENVVEIGGRSYANDDDLLNQCGFMECEECGEWEKMDEMINTSRGLICECTTLIELAEEDDDGNTYAHPDDVVRAIRVEDLEEVWLHEDFGMGEDYVEVHSAEHAALLEAREQGETPGYVINEAMDAAIPAAPEQIAA